MTEYPWMRKYKLALRIGLYRVIAKTNEIATIHTALRLDGLSNDMVAS